MHQLAFEGHDPRASVLYLSDESGQSFELPVSDELLRALGVHKTQSHAAGASDSAASSVTIIDQTDPTASNAQNERSQDNATTGRNTTTRQGQNDEQPAPAENDTANNAGAGAGADAGAANLTAVPDTADQQDSAAQNSHESQQHANSTPGQGQSKPQVPHVVPTGSSAGSGMPDRDRSRNQPMSMRPNQIQQRIRAGASAQELADEMGVDISRVEPFAHPVVLERERIAELAKQAHPVRDGGPDRLSLWEVLATAFAARGHSLADSHWDAHRSVNGEPWTIEVTWTAGLSQNSAQWLFHRHPTSADTVEPRNSVAADLVDPDFIQPVRSVTSLTRTQRVDENARDAFNAGFDGIISGDPLEDDELAAHKKRKRGSSHPLQTADTSRNAVENSADDEDNKDTRDDIPVVTDTTDKPREDSKRATSAKEAKETEGEEFLQHPETDTPKKRRRKATTPHWEDVLLGVRANTKRPRR